MRRFAGLFVLPLLACGSSPAKVAAPAQPVATASDDADAAPAPAGPSLRGTLVGHDGAPMKLAHVSIGDRHVQVAADGAFEVPNVTRGFAQVAFTGVDHGDYTAGILFGDESVEVNVALGTYERPAAYDAPLVVQIEFNDDGAISLGRTVPMTRAPDGAFVAEVKAAPGTFAYELRGVVTEAGRSMNGTDATAYRYDGDGNYANVVEVTDQPVSIRFDPKAVLPSGVPTKVAFADPTGTVARVAAVYAELDARAVEDASWQAPYRERIAAEQDPIVRRAMIVAYFASGGEHQAEADQAIANQALADIPATSSLWSMSPAAVAGAANAASDRAAARAYVDAVVDGIADPNQGGALLFTLMWNAHTSGRYEDVDHYYKVLHERFPDSPFTRPASMFDPDKQVRPGARVPDFDLASFDDRRGKARFSPEAFAGKVVLVEFWATWCKPCVEEMPNLHAMHEKYAGNGFTILSICADDSADAVRKFRKGKFPMPWPNVVLDGVEANAAKTTFEVAALPTQILVGRDGVIVGYGPELRGKGLEPAIERALGKTKQN